MELFVVRFCILLLAVQGSWCGNPCDRKPEPPYLDSAMFLNQSCYFTVINATESSTVMEWTLFRYDYIFNMTNAREVCAMHGATLPIINSEEENRFVASYEAHEFVDEWGERTIFRVALGMTRSQSISAYEWDDGTSVIYEPSDGWERKHWSSRDCATLRRQPDEPIWLSFPCHGFGVGRLGVLCKKVINPDCQYAYRSSNSCAWDDEDKKCYEIASIDILAPALKHGEPCPEHGVRKECACEEVKSDWQKDDSRLVRRDCDSKAVPAETQGKPCPLTADQNLGANSGVRKVIVDSLVVLALVSAMTQVLHGTVL